MIEGAQIESEQDGFHLVLLGDFNDEVVRYLNASRGSLELRLSQDAVFELLHAAKSQLGPWVDEFEFYQREHRRETLRAVDQDDADAYELDNPKHPGWSERVADMADTDRKRAKGE